MHNDIKNILSIGTFILTLNRKNILGLFGTQNCKSHWTHELVNQSSRIDYDKRASVGVVK
jgi:hypothetical protein